jgi:hypothetical protein
MQAPIKVMLAVAVSPWAKHTIQAVMLAINMPDVNKKLPMSYT